MRVLPLALVMLSPAAAHASCAGQMLLTCDIQDKVLEVCLNADTLTYAFGLPGAPEVQLAEPLANGTYTPWNGIGRAMWDVVAFRSGTYVYNVYTMVDRSDASAMPEWGITVENNGDPIAVLVCDTPGATMPFDGLYAEMEARGFCWHRETMQWQTGGCP